MKARQAVKFRLEMAPACEEPSFVPAHWRMFPVEKPSEVICWGYPETFPVMERLMAVAALGVSRATRAELVELGIATAPNIHLAGDMPDAD